MEGWMDGKKFSVIYRIKHTLHDTHLVLEKNRLLARLGVLHGDWWKGAHLRATVDFKWGLAPENCEFYEIRKSYTIMFGYISAIVWHFQINNSGITFQ